MVSTAEIWVYVVFFVTLVAAGLGFPAPEEIVISGAGVLAGQLPPPPDEEPAELPPWPSVAEVTALLCADPHAGSPCALPWPALVLAGSPPRQPSVAEVTAVLAADPHGGFPGAVPWAALVNASPPSRTTSRLVAPEQDKPIHVRWWILLPVCIAGVVVSDILLYGIGRRSGARLLEHRWLARLMPPEKRDKIERNFHRYGVSILVFGRLVPGIRSPLFLTAGTMRLPLARFLLADGLGAVVGNSLFFFLGFWMGDQITAVVREAEKLKPILIITGLGLLLAYLLYVFLRHPVSSGDPKEVPLIGPQVAAHITHVKPPPDTTQDRHPADNHQPPAAPAEQKVPSEDGGPR